MSQPIDFEYYFKCLLVMNQRGVYLMGRDGHIWIEYDENSEHSWSEDFVNHGIYLNNKIYGGIFEAIDTFDVAIQKMGQEPLIKQYGDWLFFGRRGADDERISHIGAGRGGIM